MRLSSGEGAKSPGRSKRLEFIGQSTGEEKKIQNKDSGGSSGVFGFVTISACVCRNYPRPREELSGGKGPELTQG